MNGQLVSKPHSLRALAGGRAIRERNEGYVGITPRTLNVQPSLSYNLLNQQRKRLFNLPFSLLKQMAFDLSPELNKTYWDFLRFCNPGYVVTADTDAAERATLEFIERLGDMHGSFENLLEMSFSNLFKYGRTIKELVLSDNARDVEDVYLPDPDIADFRKVNRGARGEVWVLGQMQTNGWVALDIPGVYYLALDNDEKNPYGRPLIDPAVYDGISLLLIKQAVQRVLENQGYSRQDYAVDTEKLLMLLQEDDTVLDDKEEPTLDKQQANFINAFLDNVKAELENKQVDSDYVHSDLITVNYAQGALTGNALSSVDAFVHRLQQGVTVGGKSIPLLQADNQSLAESQADRSLETYVNGTITPIQEKESDQWSRLFSLANQVIGVRGEVQLQFQKRRVRDRKSIAETERIQLENIQFKRDNNYITEEQARREVEMLHDPLVI